MASFLERSVAQFDPYIPTIPVDTYYAAGIQKQQAYNQGVSKVNEYLQSISGIPVVRDVDKQYVTQKLNDITSRVNQVASVDWSKQSMISQVGAMASSIYNDKTIQNAVSGTQQYRKLLSDVDQAKTSGKGYSTQNEWDALSSAQSWLSDPTPGAQYSGKSYSPYVDVSDKIHKFFKDQHPNWIVEENPMVKLSTGQPGISAYTLVNNKKEYIDQEEVSAQISSLLEPQDYNQLSINGRYNYREVNDPNQISQYIKDGTNIQINDLNAQISSWKSQLEKNRDDQGSSQQLNSYIDNATKKIEILKRSDSEYQDLLRNGNIDEVKSSIYTNRFINGWASNLGYSKTETTYKESPIFKSIMDQQDMELKNKKYLLDAQKAYYDIAKTQAEIEKLKEETIKIKKGKKEGETSGDYIPIPLSNKEAHEQSMSFGSNTQSMIDSNQDSKWKVMYDYTLSKDGEDAANKLFNATRLSEGQVVIKPKKEAEMPLNLEYENLKTSYNENPSSLSAEMKSHFDISYNTQKLINTRARIYDKVNKEADKVYNLDAELAKKQSLYFRSPKYGEFVATPKEIMDFNEKLKENIFFSKTYAGGSSIGGASGGNTSMKHPSEVTNMKSNKEKVLYEVRYRDFKEMDLHPSEQLIVNKISEISKDINSKISSVIADRSQYITKALEPYVSYQQGFSENLSTGKPEDRQKAIGYANSFYNNLNEESYKGKNGGNINKSDLGKMITADNTTYSKIFSPNGTVTDYRLSNPKIGNPITIPVDQLSTSSLGFNKVDNVYQWRDLMSLNISPTGTRYTGMDFNSSLKLINPSLQKYSVNYNIVQSGSTGALEVRFYVYDKENRKWLYKESPIAKSGWVSLEDIDEKLNSPEFERALEISMKPNDGTNTVENAARP